jgi:histidinol phosphatase-like PHP family hydrolase
MIRTQIYLTEQERDALGKMAAETGLPQSELIRNAIDHFVALSSDAHRKAVLDRTAGLWKDRDDLPDFAAIRRQWDRGWRT